MSTPFIKRLYILINSSIGSYFLAALLNTLQVCRELEEVVAGRCRSRLIKFKPIIDDVISYRAFSVKLSYKPLLIVLINRTILASFQANSITVPSSKSFLYSIPHLI